jgi:hypothetical protein
MAHLILSVGCRDLALRAFQAVVVSLIILRHASSLCRCLLSIRRYLIVAGRALNHLLITFTRLLRDRSLDVEWGMVASDTNGVADSMH